MMSFSKISAAFLAANLSAFAADSASPVVGGFVDSQFHWSNTKANSRGIHLHDGAIYFSHALGGSDLKIDVPFRLMTAGSPNLSIGMVRGQAYVAHTYENGFRWKMGQFDTSFGFEMNDSADVFFTQQGSVYNFTDPFVHLGLLAGYDLSKDMGINFIVGAPKDAGASGSSNGQFGLQFVKTGDMRFAIGGLMNKPNGAEKFSIYGDMTVGATLGDFDIDLEVNYTMLGDAMNPDALTDQLSGLGALLNLQYKLSDTVAIGYRGEFVTGLGRMDPYGTDTTTMKQQMTGAIGPRFQMTKNMQVKVNYLMTMNTAWDVLGGASDTGHAAALSAVYKF